MHKYHPDTIQTERGRLDQADRFLRKLYQEWDQPGELAERLDVLARDRVYHPTAKELEGAARLAWRNANRCIGRIYWKS